jgi:hypothetical protein
MAGEIFEVEKVEDVVWCDLHGDIHDERRNPYDIVHHYEKKTGRPVVLVYDDDDDATVEAEPECGPENWRSLYHGDEGVYEPTPRSKRA